MPRHAPLPPLTPERQALAERHWRLARMIAGKLTRRAPWLADELQSEAYLGLVMAATRCETERTPEEQLSYLAQGATSRVLDAIRDQRPRGYGRGAKAPSVGSLGDADPTDGRDDVARVDADDAFTSLLGGLSARSRRILGLIYRDGCTQGDVARLLGLSQPRVQQLHAEALESLRRTVLTP